MPNPVKLKRFKPGTELKASDLNLLVDAINAGQPMPGHGINIRNTYGGTLISRKADPPGKGGGSFRFIEVSLTGGTAFPVLATLITDIQSAYSTASLTPKDGDFLISLPFHWVVGPSTPTNGGSWPSNELSQFSFTVDSTSKRAFQIGPHRFFKFT